MLQVMWPQIKDTDQPTFFSNWLQAALEHVWQPYEVAILGPQAPEMALELQRHFLPSAVVLAGTDEGSLEMLKDRLVEGENMIYVCQNGVCKLPVGTPDKALELMKYYCSCNARTTGAGFGLHAPFVGAHVQVFVFGSYKVDIYAFVAVGLGIAYAGAFGLHVHLIRVLHKTDVMG